MKTTVAAALGMVVIATIVGILVVNGYVKSVDLKFMKVEFKGEPMTRLCFPMWNAEATVVEDVTLNKATAHSGDTLGDWHIDGADGQGGTLLSYRFRGEGRISKVEVKSCSGCGGHFWLCPDPRCGARKTFTSSPDGQWIAHSATDGAPATSTTYQVTRVVTKPKCLW